MEHQVMLTTIIAVFALITGIGFIVSLLLNPVKENQKRLEKNLTNLEQNQKNLEKNQHKLEQNQNTLEQNQKNLSEKMDWAFKDIKALITDIQKNLPKSN